MTPTRISEKTERLRETFNTGRTRDIEKRIELLASLKSLLKENRHSILDALKLDLNKSENEAWLTEYNETVKETERAIKQVRKWARPEKVRTPMVHKPGKSFIHKEPLGVVLIIGPWNYPWVLMISPLIGALAAGNTVMLKPSEISEHTSALLARLIPKYFPPEIVDIVEGGIEETTEILRQQFDHIFFTGGETVGKIVMTAAANHLTPVTLELGGKSPCIVDKEVDLEIAAKRIVWGKFLNAGQTCVAPDYLLVHRDIKDDLTRSLVTAIRKSLGDNPEKSNDYGRIINTPHFNRLVSLLECGNIITGGSTNPETRYIEPTILDTIPETAPVMSEEIFGPILPVIPVDSTEDAIRFVNSRPKPLALYCFSENKAIQEKIIRETSSGGICVNDTIVHISSPHLPFGGVGTSGMGNYHGKASFDCFSHRKSVLKKTTRPDPSLRYPPYSRWVQPFMRLVEKFD